MIGNLLFGPKNCYKMMGSVDDMIIVMRGCVGPEPEPSFFIY